MANRRRMIDERFWTDEDVGELSPAERLLMLCMITKCADDFGRLLATSRYLKVEAFGYDDSLSVAEVECMRDRITQVCRNVTLYAIDGRPYIELKNFSKYQFLEYQARTTIPGPDGLVPTNFGKVRKGKAKGGAHSQKFAENVRTSANFQESRVEESRVEESNIDHREVVVVKSPPHNNHRDPTSIETPLGLYLDSFAHANPQQRRDLEKITEEVGDEIALAAVRWAARNGIADTDKIWTAARNMKTNGIGKGRPASLPAKEKPYVPVMLGRNPSPGVI